MYMETIYHKHNRSFSCFHQLSHPPPCIVSGSRKGQWLTHWSHAARGCCVEGGEPAVESAAGEPSSPLQWRGHISSSGYSESRGSLGAATTALGMQYFFTAGQANSSSCCLWGLATWESVLFHGSTSTKWRFRWWCYWFDADHDDGNHNHGDGFVWTCGIHRYTHIWCFVMLIYVKPCSKT